MAFSVPTEGDNDPDAQAHEVTRTMPESAIEMHQLAIHKASTTAALRTVFGVAYKAAKAIGDAAAAKALQDFYEGPQADAGRSRGSSGMSTLYELAAEYRDAHERMEAAGFDDQTIADTLDEIGRTWKKAIAVAKFVRNLEAEAAAIDKAIMAMNCRHAKALDDRATSLRKNCASI